MLEIAAFVISSICMIINGYLLYKVQGLRKETQKAIKEGNLNISRMNALKKRR